MRIIKLVVTDTDLDHLSDCDDMVHEFVKSSHGQLLRVELTFRESALERIREELSPTNTGWRNVSVTETTVADTVIVTLRQEKQ
jgi:hypothetical protein